jgi:hypothetical protein
MRSVTGIAAAIVMLLAVPAAIGAEMIAPGSVEVVLHFAVGAGCVLLAAAMFDFGGPRWATVIGAAAAAAFGGIFLLQGTSQIVHNDALNTLAFDVLGQEIERLLPYVILAWFAVVLLAGSRGRSRILGWVVMSVVVGVEVLAVAGPIVGIHVDSQKLLFLLPFAWLLVESAKPAPDHDSDVRTRGFSPASTGSVS